MSQRLTKRPVVGIDAKGKQQRLPALVNADGIELTRVMLTRRVLIDVSTAKHRQAWHSWKKRFGVIPSHECPREYLADGYDEYGEPRLHVRQCCTLSCSETALECLRLACPTILLACGLTDSGIVISASGAGSKPFAPSIGRQLSSTAQPDNRARII
jgi:hypothetical protein